NGLISLRSPPGIGSFRAVDNLDHGVVACRCRPAKLEVLRGRRADPLGRFRDPPHQHTTMSRTADVKVTDGLAGELLNAHCVRSARRASDEGGCYQVVELPIWTLTVHPDDRWGRPRNRQPISDRLLDLQGSETASAETNSRFADYYEREGAPSLAQSELHS